MRWPSFPEGHTVSALGPAVFDAAGKETRPKLNVPALEPGVYLGAAESGGTYSLLIDGREGYLDYSRPSSTKLSVIWDSPTKLPATAVKRAQSVIDSLGIDPSTVTEPATYAEDNSEGKISWSVGLELPGGAQALGAGGEAGYPEGLRVTTKTQVPAGVRGPVYGFPSPEPLVLAAWVPNGTATDRQLPKLVVARDARGKEVARADFTTVRMFEAPGAKTVDYVLGNGKVVSQPITDTGVEPS